MLKTGVLLNIFVEVIMFFSGFFDESSNNQVVHTCSLIRGSAYFPSIFINSKHYWQ